ncbi:hypothetical protein EV144_102221 [Flavobacterium sp. 270]|uniref:porin family protein n=1 Tax=Flavobacterium sp. 270 TaxID=2512114 RepID=UPI00106477E2|nr:porin family protein [Flavobacterium sp. 270]TDW49798.1 hypothetical protein EV144_102221 [Flavobacterium sp. 270]
MENRNEIGTTIKDKLALLDKKPSDKLWASIESDLNKKRKRRILFWLIPSLLTAVVLTSAFFFIEFDQEKDNLSNDKQKQITTQQNPSKVSITNTTSKVAVSKTKTNTKGTEEQSTETTTIKKSRTEKLIKESKKLILSTDEYEEYEVVKKYKVIVKKKQTTTTHKTSFPKIAKTTKKPYKAPINKNKINKKKPLNKPKKSTPFPATKATDSINDKIFSKEIGKSDKILPSITEEIKVTEKDSAVEKPKRQTTPKREYVKRDYPQQKESSDAEYSVSAFYGPALFGSLSNQSMVNPILSNRSKGHPITSHYGFYFKSMYNKLGFRVGVSKINLKITTSLDQNQLITNYNNITLKYYSSEMINNEFKNSGPVDLEQKLSYYEMPLEFNYALKKDESPFGIEVFTGFSILILDDNKLFLSSDKIKNKQIGKVKSISETNLSYNLGLGLNYKLTEKIQLDFNPIFKYYLTTFNEGNASKPYSLSIQSGVTYKF